MRDLGDELTIVIPLWLRTRNILRVGHSASVATPEAEVIFVVSEDDRLVRDYLTDFGVPEAPSDHLRSWQLVVPGYGGGAGDYAKKINAGYRASSRPFIFTGADDIVFGDGWYAPARELIDDATIRTITTPGGGTLTGPFPIPEIGVVGTVDGLNGRTLTGEHSTHSLVARWYADQGACPEIGNIIYFEGYIHEYCDDELCQVAMARKAYAHSFASTVQHLHWLGDRTLDDETYRQGRSGTRMSRLTFLKRQRLWGGQRR